MILRVLFMAYARWALLVVLALVLLGACVGRALASTRPGDYAFVASTAGVGGSYRAHLDAQAVDVDGDTVRVDTVIGEASASPHDRLKVFLPPGTKSLAVGVSSYIDSRPASVVFRMFTPPAGLGTPIQTADTRGVLAALGRGAELSSTSDGGSGGLAISYYDANSVTQLAEGGYVYFRFDSIPGGRFIRLQFSVYVSKACFLSWKSSARWSADGSPAEGVDGAHGCAGSSQGGSQELRALAFDVSELVMGATSRAWLSAVPAGATMGDCRSDRDFVLLAPEGSGMRLSIAPDAASRADLQLNAYVATISCAAASGARVQAQLNVRLRSALLSIVPGLRVHLVPANHEQVDRFEVVFDLTAPDFGPDPSRQGAHLYAGLLHANGFAMYSASLGWVDANDTRVKSPFDLLAAAPVLPAPAQAQPSARVSVVLPVGGLPLGLLDGIFASVHVAVISGAGSGPVLAVRAAAPSTPATLLSLFPPGMGTWSNLLSFCPAASQARHYCDIGRAM